MSKGSSGLFKNTSGAKSTQSELASKTQKAVNDLIKNTSGSRKKAMAVGAYDVKTGRIETCFAGEIPSRIAPELVEKAKIIGGIGSHGITEHNIVGVCAEFQVVNKLLLGGSKWNDIHLTKPIRPRTGQQMPFCSNCKAMFGDLIDD